MTGATARSVDESGARGDALRTRFFSAIALAVPVLIVVHVGFPLFEAMVALAAAVLAREWVRLCLGTVPTPILAITVAACVAPVLAAAAGEYAIAAAVVAVGAVVVFVAPRGGLWPAAGVLYIAAPCLAFVWLRSDAAGGRDLVFWLLVVVWATDIGAYACGRSIGGPRLAPALSPNKTWAGLAGGIVFAAATGTLVAAALGAAAAWTVALAGACIAVAAQAGDLLESWCKRRFGVKDAGGLIPGHGGLLDRVDGLMAASALAALIGLLAGGSMGAWM